MTSPFKVGAAGRFASSSFPDHPGVFPTFLFYI